MTPFFPSFVTTSFGTILGAKTNESIQSNLICTNSTTFPTWKSAYRISVDSTHQTEV